MAIDTTNILVRPYDGYMNARVVHITLPAEKK
jgi:hypothetical protein